MKPATLSIHFKSSLCDSISGSGSGGDHDCIIQDESCRLRPNIRPQKDAFLWWCCRRRLLFFTVVAHLAVYLLGRKAHQHHVELTKVVHWQVRLTPGACGAAGTTGRLFVLSALLVSVALNGGRAICIRDGGRHVKLCTDAFARDWVHKCSFIWYIHRTSNSTLLPRAGGRCSANSQCRSACRTAHSPTLCHSPPSPSLQRTGNTSTSNPCISGTAWCSGHGGSPAPH